ncbi:hypothetical protein CRYUN_Cryun02cG0196900 [Craigia yunnanensis]
MRVTLGKMRGKWYLRRVRERSIRRRRKVGRKIQNFQGNGVNVEERKKGNEEERGGEKKKKKRKSREIEQAIENNSSSEPRKRKKKKIKNEVDK